MSASLTLREDARVPQNPLHVRAMTPADRGAVRDLALVNGMFAPEEMSGFDEMMAGYLDGTLTDQHWAVATVPDDPAAVLGAGYWAPEAFGDRVWNLYFLAVHPRAHGRGAGSALVRHIVDSLTAAGEDVARVPIVETSSTDTYQPARAFYAARGFVEEARIREFYGPGDDKVVFWRGLLG
jgi:ribosomal protein S18 acetylase RimI-like enzyme